MNKSRIRRVRSSIWALLLLLGCTLTLPVIPYLWTSTVSASASENADQSNPRANFWRNVRAGDEGYSAIRGSDTNILINSQGQNWRQFRMKLLAPYGALLMGSVLFAIAVFYAVRGSIGYSSESPAKPILRFSVYQRIIHWFTAILFWILALTGLILLYGRFVLIPLFGSSGFALTASASKEAHNLFGPIFMVALVLLAVEYAKDNVFRKEDVSWIVKGGGIFRGHASAGRFNCGEKIWFWLVVLLGATISISGLVLDFAVLGFSRITLELAHVLHGIAALVFISAAFGHVYLGTVGTRGTLRGMTTGLVDSAWAKLHHDRWLEEQVDAPEPAAPDNAR